jgi:hypothetical protein
MSARSEARARTLMRRPVPTHCGGEGRPDGRFRTASSRVERQRRVARRGSWLGASPWDSLVRPGSARPGWRWFLAYALRGRGAGVMRWTIERDEARWLEESTSTNAATRTSHSFRTASLLAVDAAGLLVCVAATSRSRLTSCGPAACGPTSRGPVDAGIVGRRGARLCRMHRSPRSFMASRWPDRCVALTGASDGLGRRRRTLADAFGNGAASTTGEDAWVRWTTCRQA